MAGVSSTDATVVLSAVLLFLWFRGNKTSGPPLPPGPKKLPLLGNLLDMPTEHEWLKFTTWAGQYGNMVSVSVFGQQYIIVNSAKTAVELLEKKSRIHSDRPVIQMGGELVGWRDTLVLIPYGHRFRNYRKMFHQVIGTHDAMSKFYHIEEMETHRFLKDIQAKPEQLAAHIRRTAGAIILRIAYGYEVKEGRDPFVSAADEAVEQFSISTSPGAFLVNLVPSLRHVPDWFPGAGFKQTARAWKQTLYDMVEGPYKFVKEQRDLGTAEPSMLLNLLQDESNLSASDIYDIKWVTASLYSGGADTTVSAIYSFFKAMVLYPDVQAQAQAEIDEVIGNDALPTVDDRVRLPFVSALAMEALRWHIVTPTGVPHRVMEDDIHDGYLIPKGALIIPNIWMMGHDPSIYQDPMEFKPARFIKTESHNPEPDPRDLCFGFGRRICPGRVLADVSVFLSCAVTLAVFKITPHMENGKPVMPDLTQSTGTISHPSEFKCTIKPRSQKALELINAV
ncbi:cytochrome P450 [Amanita rubescens]|nr:cytochrome P450 [Amanita rubescens]